MKLDMAVHPVADLFPMLPVDELADLAADIKERGQLQPIVLDKDSRILDGRNRFAACKLAGVEPKFVTYDGDDPDGYALAVNVARRHMMKGQQAIVVAKANRIQGGEKLTSREAGRVYGVDSSRFRQANVILDFAPDLVDDILSGSGKFDAAYEIAKERKQAQQQRAEDAESIREEAPDLADAVAEESITLADAKEELKRRQEDEARARRIASIDILVAESGGRTFAGRVESKELTWAEAENLAGQWKREWDDNVMRNVERIEAVAAKFPALSRLLDAPDELFNQAVIAKLDDVTMKFIRSVLNEINEKSDNWNGAWK